MWTIHIMICLYYVYIYLQYILHACRWYHYSYNSSCEGEMTGFCTSRHVKHGSLVFVPFILSVVIVIGTRVFKPQGKHIV